MPYDEQDFEDPTCKKCGDFHSLCISCDENPEGCRCPSKMFGPCTECKGGTP